MIKIVNKKVIAENIVMIELESDSISKKIQAGQFIILRVNSKGERIPLTVVDKNCQKGTITLVYQIVGKTTKLLNKLNIGDSISDLVGPLGHPTEIKNYGTVVVVGGGVGIAELLPVSKSLKEIGNIVIGIIGAKTKNMLIFENEMRTVCDKLFITTDDGSYERKGFVTDVLKELLVQSTNNISIVYAVGPVPMMKSVCEITKLSNIKTIVSLNPIMVDGTGMCGSCRVSINNETKFACVDGPEFDGHAVDWDELSKRLKLFVEQEKVALDTLE